MNLITIGTFVIPISLGIASLIREYSADNVTIGTRFFIPYKVSLDKHLCVLGSTRSGKSSLIRAMIKELSKRYVVTVLDWHGEYVGVLPTIPTSAVEINLERIPPKLLTEILGFGLGLNEPSMYMFYRIIRDGGYTSFSDLISKIDNYLVNTRTEAEMKAAILRRLEYVASNIGKGLISIEELMKGDSVIDLSDLTIIEEKRLVSSLILATLYMQYMKSGLIGRGVEHILIIEEAQNLIDMNGLGYSIIDHVIMELAKYGLRVVLISNVIPRTSLLKHCNIVLFKINPELLGNDEISLSRDLVEKLSKMTVEDVLVITNKGIVKVKPLRLPARPNHIIIRRIEEKHPSYMNDKVMDNNTEHLENTFNNENKSNERTYEGSFNVNNNGNKLIQNAVEALGKGNVSLPNDESIFKKQIAELEREVLNLRDRISEIERILEVDEKMIERILEFDNKLKGNSKDNQ